MTVEYSARPIDQIQIVQQSSTEEPLTGETTVWETPESPLGGNQLSNEERENADWAAKLKNMLLLFVHHFPIKREISPNILAMVNQISFTLNKFAISNANSNTKEEDLNNNQNNEPLIWLRLPYEKYIWKGLKRVCTPFNIKVTGANAPNIGQ